MAEWLKRAPGFRIAAAAFAWVMRDMHPGDMSLPMLFAGSLALGRTGLTLTQIRLSVGEPEAAEAAA